MMKEEFSSTHSGLTVSELKFFRQLVSDIKLKTGGSFVPTNTFHSSISCHSVSHSSPNSWIIDSGASEHMTCNSSLLQSYHYINKTESVRVANGTHVPVHGWGTSNCLPSLPLSSVLHVPSLSVNLLSVQKITENLNCSVTFFPSHCVFQDLATGKVLGSGKVVDGLYIMEGNSVSPSASYQAAQDGVDIISLSITPNRRPPGIATYFNPIDMALLAAVKVGIFVVQAAGNTGPSPKSISSFSPWIFTVGAAAHGRVYSNSILLGNNITIPGVGLAPGTKNASMYTMVSAIHALNDTAAVNNMYVGECQDPNSLNRDIIQGNLLICSYSIRFVLGMSSIKQALATAKNLSAVGVVFYLDPFVIGYQLNPVPMAIPGIILSSPDDSKILLQYYNSSLNRDAVTQKIIKFGAVASISGGVKATFSNSVPKVMYYSARGPDPEDKFLDDADILKPNLVAPGNLIWSAWSSYGTDSAEFLGEEFAMMSGTSMAAPHIAGLAALIKMKFPSFSPSAIGSALSTTASLNDKNGQLMMAQRAYSNPDLNQSPATPFDMGSGFVNATAALNPGLIFDVAYEDYMSFLCSINGSSPVVLNYTGLSCKTSTINGADLNLPSITIAKLDQSRTVQRTVMNIASNETYKVGWTAPLGASLMAEPMHFFIASGEKQVLTISINATANSPVASFGKIGLFGDKGHTIHIPVSIISKNCYNTTKT